MANVYCRFRQLLGIERSFFISVGSSAQFRLKSEREWEERQNVFTTEFFSLDIRVLESAIACIPLHTQLQMDENEFDVILFSFCLEVTW